MNDKVNTDEQMCGRDAGGDFKAKVMNELEWLCNVATQCCRSIKFTLLPHYKLRLSNV